MNDLLRIVGFAWRVCDAPQWAGKNCMLRSFSRTVVRQQRRRSVAVYAAHSVPVQTFDNAGA
jgi:hypothetical protein